MFKQHVCDHFSDYYAIHGHCPPNSPTVTPWWAWLVLAVLIVLFLLIVASFIRIVQAYENGVIFRLGKYSRTVEPGLRLKWPFIEWMAKVSMQIETVELDPQQVITKDSVSLSIQAVVYYKVINAEDSVIKIDDIEDSIARLAPAIMRRVIGKHELGDVLSHNESVDSAIKDELENATTEWGVRIDRIELQDVQLPESMSRAMAARAEASREAEAKVLASEGELKSAENLKKAAALLDPTALRLRELQTMREIGTDNATIIVVQGEGGAQLAANGAAGALAAGKSASES